MSQDDLFGGPPGPASKRKRLGTPEEARLVWDAWVKRQRRPACCFYTQDRERLIRERIGLGYPAEALATLIRYAYEADTPQARFWRGENDRQTQYLGLDNILREKGMGDRVTAALTWAEDAKAPPSGPDAPNGPTGGGLQGITGGAAYRARRVSR